MRSVWIASGLMFALLSLAALLRPGEQGDAGILKAGHLTDDAQKSASELGGGSVGVADERRPLAVADLAQIMAVRSEIGGAADPLNDGAATAAAFERELRHLAGLEYGDLPAEARPADRRETEVLIEGGLTARCQAILRRAAAEMEQLANDAEDVGDYSQADDLRLATQRIREVRRTQSVSEIEPQKPNAGDGLIDNCPERQAQ